MTYEGVCVTSSSESKKYEMRGKSPLRNQASSSLLNFSLLDTEYNVGLLEMAIPPEPKLQLIDAILE
jgi:hypothetical protein